ncbi:hypothetical protein QZH41_019390, partial [Actinostola sp. cb2023]
WSSPSPDNCSYQASPWSMEAIPMVQGMNMHPMNHGIPQWPTTSARASLDFTGNGESSLSEIVMSVCGDFGNREDQCCLEHEIKGFNNNNNINAVNETHTKVKVKKDKNSVNTVEKKRNSRSLSRKPEAYKRQKKLTIGKLHSSQPDALITDLLTPSESSVGSDSMESSSTDDSHHRGCTSHIKRPMNAFMLFSKANRERFKKMYPGRDNRRISTILGEHWKGMSKEDKVPFQEMAKELMRKTKEAYPEFKYSPSDQNKVGAESCSREGSPKKHFRLV